jgi:hypothetical protein
MTFVYRTWHMENGMGNEDKNLHSPFRFLLFEAQKESRINLRFSTSNAALDQQTESQPEGSPELAGTEPALRR